jgi:carbon-monoxide dehydrogenase medium subunit
MSPEEILTEITIPKTSPQLVGEYIKFSPRDMMDLAYVGVAVAYNITADKRCSGVRIVLGAVAPTPIRAHNAEALLEGQLTEEGCERGARQPEVSPSAMSGHPPISPAMVEAMTKRALLNAAVPRTEKPGVTDETGDIRRLECWNNGVWSNG